MKKFITLLLTICISFGLLSSLTGCNESSNELVLRICNWEEYISENEDTGLFLYEEFELWYEEQTGEDITVQYSTFGTPEILYNNMKINPGSYDLVCPSDYMIQKMMHEDMLESFDNIATDVPNYYNYASPYMKQMFDKYGWTNYAIPYMWGTMGFVYNPEFVSYDDAYTFSCVIDEKYKNKTTIKDSVRDTYFLGIALANKDLLTEKYEAFENGTLSLTEYSDTLQTIFNDTSEQTVSAVEELLKKAKNNAFSLEVDSGKDDMVTGKVYINFAWSGDAVYAMDEAEGVYLEDEDLEDFTPTYLNYAVPYEGSNIWFDGWVMPKGANKKLACAFLDYISSPEKAIENMDYIGYTSAIAGQEIFDRLLDEEGYACTLEPTEDNTVAFDLSYFFGPVESGQAIVYTDEDSVERQLGAQYPTTDIIARCAVMQHFEDEDNDRINNMWNRVKADDVIQYLFIIIAVIVAIILIILLGVLYVRGLPQIPMSKKYKRIK